MSRPPIFIVGCSRSGTSLLRNLLRSHPSLAFPYESHFIPRLFRAYGDPRTDREARRLAAIILGLHWVERWNLSIEPSSFASCRSYSEIVAHLFAEYARQQEKPRWGDKTPDYVTEIPTLLHLFPTARILHIIRDGRDVALSWMMHRYGARNLYTAATLWKDRVSAGRNAGATLRPEAYLEVRYEALLGDSRASMKRVCAFIDEPFVDAVLTPTALVNESSFPLLLGTRTRRVRAPEILHANREKWKREMTRSDRVLFESIAGDLLRALDYETEGSGRRVSRLELLAWRVDHRTRYALGRLDTGQKLGWLRSTLRMWWARARAAVRRTPPGPDDP